MYETLPGWGTDIDAREPLEDLPAAARDYVRFIEEFAGVPVTLRRRRPGARSDRRAAPRRVDRRRASSSSVAAGASTRSRGGSRARPTSTRSSARPGNPGMAELGECRAGRRERPGRGRRARRRARRRSRRRRARGPLVAGVVDARRRARGRLAFGPHGRGRAARRVEGVDEGRARERGGARPPATRTFAAGRGGRGARVPRDAAGPLRREDRRPRRGQGRDRHRVARRRARRGARVPVGRGVRRRRPHAA